MDVTRATFDRIIVTGIGSNGSGIRIEASDLGASGELWQGRFIDHAP